MLKKCGLLLLLSSCKTTIPEGSKFYKKNLAFEINGKDYNGTAVIDYGDSFYIKTSFPTKIDKLKINTCHRYKVANNIGKSYKFRYTKITGIEDRGVCVMDVGAFEKGYQNSWGLIEFRNDQDVDLIADIRCNGESFLSSGVSICQSQIGLRQSINFSKETKLFAQDECEKPFTYDKKTFYYDIEAGNCLYLFQQGKRFHRLRTYGFHDEL